ncbi:MAG TPA: hypothetical protein VHE81_12740 [Lacipirellulaceae bacterium]|nr:hypothetical protein [Lacipirellulaceae bacterium]
MSTATNNATIAYTGPRRPLMFWRFAWKEFRMIRGLWVAVAILGFAVECAEKVLLPPSSNIALTLFDTALASAVLYAAGAAATSFSVEHEDETYDLLLRLSASWWPVFASKVAVAAVSAALLAAALSITGWPLNGSATLGAADASTALGMLGLGILEAVAWGTLFSLLIRRPLLAAIVTLVVGLAVVNMAVNFMSTTVEASATPQAYADAVPLRLAIVVAVFAASLVAARGWLTVGSRPAAGRFRMFARRAACRTQTIEATQRTGAVASIGSRRRMVARLLWQTWRESWILLLFPLIAGALLMIGISAAAGVSIRTSDVTAYVVGSTLFFVPALYGAMAFYSDQRRGNYRFLAEHAARPRYVWFARQTIWLGSLAAVWLLVGSVLTMMIARRIGHENQEFRNAYFIWDTYAIGNSRRVLFDLTEGVRSATRGAGLAACGALVAYSVGQFCSMALRSEILAAFIALLLSTVVVAWTATLAVWQLPGWLFLLPLFVGLMAATWLRAPDWIAGHNSLRRWWKPALAVVAPIVLMGVVLPTVRLDQIPTNLIDLRMPYPVGHETNEFAMSVELDRLKKLDTPAARETADMYIKAVDQYEGPPKIDFLTPWEKPEFYEAAPGHSAFGIDESKIPKDQLDAFRAAKKKVLELIRKKHAAYAALVLKASKRPTCYFDFASQLTGLRPAELNTHNELVRVCPVYGKLVSLLDDVLLESIHSNALSFEWTDSFDRYLAALRMSAQLRNGQPSIIFCDQVETEQKVLEWLAGWAAGNNRTKADLLGAIEKLRDVFRDSPKPQISLLADYVQVRNVLIGKDVPWILNPASLNLDHIPPSNYLAFMANDLPWERQRALMALDRITLRNIQNVTELVELLANKRPGESGSSSLHRWLRPRYGGLPPLWEIQEPAATTSYLASLEYKARVSVSELCRAYCDNETCRRATLIRLALAAYRLDHKKYPPRLDDLAPQYLDRLPLDPYSQQPFVYEPAGLPYSVPYSGVRRMYAVVEPNTPVFWSVGPGNARLKLAHSTRFEAADANQPEGQARETDELVYRLTNDEPGWWDDRKFVFPLPK